MSNVIRLPSARAGSYRVQLQTPNGQPFTVIVEVPCQDNKIVEKPLQLSAPSVAGDILSYTNLIPEAQREAINRASVIKKPKGQNDGYSNLEDEFFGWPNPYAGNLPKLLRARGY